MKKRYNKNLPDSNTFGYGCINNTRIRVNEIEDRSKNTKSYKELVKSFKNNFFPENLIVIDILNGNHSERINLNLIIQNLSTKFALSYKPKGYIIIPTLSELGTTVREVKKNYQNILDNRIAVLILDNEELSCCDYGFDDFTKTKEEMNYLLSTITSKDIINKQGRDKTHILDDNFKQLYWYYENYFITEDIVLTNNLIGHFTKKVFYRLCSEYEASNEYAHDEIQEINKSKGLLLDKPKRYGMTKNLKKKFPELISLIDSGKSIEESCKLLEIQIMTEYTFKRFLLRFNTGKKGISQSSKLYYDEDISSKISL